MKEKTILKIIKDDFELNTPDILNKIDLRSIIIEPTPQVIKRRFNFNIFSQVSLVTAALAIGLFIGILISKPKNLLSSPDIVNVTAKDTTVASYVTSGLNLAVSNVNANINMINISQFNPVTLNNIDTFHDNVGIFEEYLGLNSNNISIITNHMEKSMSNYDYKMIIQNKSILGTSASYVLYYNEKREVDGDEEEKVMKGILIADKLIFNFESEVEIDGGESELKVTIYNESIKVVIKEELEHDEYSYIFKVYENNTLIKEINFSVEDDEIMLKIKNGIIKTEYYIIKIDELKFLISLGDDDEDQSFTLIIDTKNENYKYYYNNSVIEKQ